MNKKLLSDLRFVGIVVFYLIVFYSIGGILNSYLKDFKHETIFNNIIIENIVIGVSFCFIILFLFIALWTFTRVILILLSTIMSRYMEDSSIFSKTSSIMGIFENFFYNKMLFLLSFNFRESKNLNFKEFREHYEKKSK
jgi:hypothetical protein